MGGRETWGPLDQGVIDRGTNHQLTRFRNPVLIGATVCAAVAILVGGSFFVGLQLGRGSNRSGSSVMPALSPVATPTRRLVVASAVSLLPNSSDFPGVYVASGQSVSPIVGTPGGSETLQGINGNPFSAYVDVAIYPTIARAQERYEDVIASFGNQPPLPLARRYGDEAQLNGQPATSSVPQLILQWRDRNVVAGVTIYDNSRSVASQAMTTALYAIADLFSARIAAA